MFQVLGVHMMYLALQGYRYNICRGFSVVASDWYFLSKELI